MTESLFGVEAGDCLGVLVEWNADSDATHQSVHVVMRWTNRRPTEVYVQVPDDQLVSNYVSRWNGVLLNAAYIPRARLSVMVHAILAATEADGAKVTMRGTTFGRR